MPLLCPSEQDFSIVMLVRMPFAPWCSRRCKKGRILLYFHHSLVSYMVNYGYWWIDKLNSGILHLAELHLLIFCSLLKSMLLAISFLLLKHELESLEDVEEPYLFRSAGEVGRQCLEGTGLSIRAPKLHTCKEEVRIRLTFTEGHKHTGSRALVRSSVRTVTYLACWKRCPLLPQYLPSIATFPGIAWAHPEFIQG